MAVRDYYEVLGVRRDAEPDAIKHAYRRLSRVLHPDVSADPESGERFRELSEAYAVLSRSESRRLYDRFGWRGKGGGFERRPVRVYHSDKRGLLQDLEGLIVSIAGGQPSRKPARVVGNLEVDAYEAHIGATRRLEVGEELRCDECEGSGRRKVVASSDAIRFLSLDDCGTCGGTGIAVERRAVEIPVPPGARDLDPIRVGPEEVAIVTIVPPRERPAVRAAAFGGLLFALGFLLFLLAL